VQVLLRPNLVIPSLVSPFFLCWFVWLDNSHAFGGTRLRNLRGWFKLRFSRHWRHALPLIEASPSSALKPHSNADRFIATPPPPHIQRPQFLPTPRTTPNLHPSFAFHHGLLAFYSPTSCTTWLLLLPSLFD